MQSLKKIHAWAQMQDPLCFIMHLNGEFFEQLTIEASHYSHLICLT